MYDQEELLENLFETLSGVLIDYEEMSGKAVGVELSIEGKYWVYDGEKLSPVKKQLEEGGE